MEPLTQSDCGRTEASAPSDKKYASGFTECRDGPTPETYVQASDLVATATQKFCEAGMQGSDAGKLALSLFNAVFRHGNFPAHCEDV